MRPDSSGARRAERAAAAAAGLTVEPEVGRSRRRAATDSHLKSGRMSVRSISVTSHCPVFCFVFLPEERRTRGTRESASVYNFRYVSLHKVKVSRLKKPIYVHLSSGHQPFLHHGPV